MTTLVCPFCHVRWKVRVDAIDRDITEACPNCACDRCTRGTFVDSNGSPHRCHFCKGTGRKGKAA